MNIKLKKLVPKKEIVFKAMIILAGIGLLLTTFLPIFLAAY